MPFKTRDISELRGKPKANRISLSERDSAASFDRLSKTVAWLREHGHGGRIVLPLPVMSLNQKRHYIETAKIKKQYQEYANLILQSRLMPPPPATIPDHVTISVQFYTPAPTDYDNLTAKLKPILDFLKGRYIVDDDDRHLTVESRVQIIDRKNPRVQITILEL